MNSNRTPVWGIIAAIFNILVGLGVIGISGLVIFGSTLLGDSLNTSARLFVGPDSNPGDFFYIFTIVGIFFLLLGIARIVAAIGLFMLRNWGRMMAIGLQGFFALFGLMQIVLLFRLGSTGIALFSSLLFICEVVLLVGLMMQDTAFAYTTPALSGSSRRTQLTTRVHPDYNGGFDHLPQTQPNAGYINNPAPHAVQQQQPSVAKQMAPTERAAPSGGNYAQPGPVGVAKTEMAYAEPEVMAWLVERNGPRAGREHRLRAQVTVGRDPNRCELTLDDTKVSSEHARIRLENGHYVIYDLASTNHTFINGKEVQKHVLRDGDQIRLGPNVQLSFMLVANK